MNNQVLISQEIIFCDFFLSACYESMFSYAWTWVLQYYMVCELIKLCALGTDSRLVSRSRAEGRRDLKCKKLHACSGFYLFSLYIVQRLNKKRNLFFA